MRRCLPGGPDGEALVLVGAAVAIQLAQGRGEEELGVLAAFFDVLGDNLALMLAQRAGAAAQQSQACVKPSDSCCESGDLRVE